MSTDSQIASFISKAQAFGSAAAKSKTIWASVVIPAIVSLIPPAAPWVAANPDTAAWIVGAIMAALRLVTHTSITRPEPAPVLDFAAKQPPTK